MVRNTWELYWSLVVKIRVISRSVYNRRLTPRSWWRMWVCVCVFVRLETTCFLPDGDPILRLRLRFLPPEVRPFSMNKLLLHKTSAICFRSNETGESAKNSFEASSTVVQVYWARRATLKLINSYFPMWIIVHIEFLPLLLLIHFESSLRVSLSPVRSSFIGSISVLALPVLSRPLNECKFN